MKALKWAGAACMAVLLLVYPETALDAARQSMLTWAQSVAPALFPFMVLAPLLMALFAPQERIRLLPVGKEKVK